MAIEWIEDAFAIVGETDTCVLTRLWGANGRRDPGNLDLIMFINALQTSQLPSSGLICRLKSSITSIAGNLSLLSCLPTYGTPAVPPSPEFPKQTPSLKNVISVITNNIPTITPVVFFLLFREPEKGISVHDSPSPVAMRPGQGTPEARQLSPAIPRQLFEIEFEFVFGSSQPANPNANGKTLRTQGEESPVFFTDFEHIEHAYIIHTFSTSASGGVYFLIVLLFLFFDGEQRQ
uniref:Uncharacterized protein n=1 Tax=Panagrellus redivivus TaxID=6233 RepID=A0A7E4VQ18_PANRE